MGKNSKKRKQTAEAVATTSKKLKVLPNDIPEIAEISENTKLIGGLLFNEELDTTTDTLTILAQNPTLIHSKALKGFRTAVHDYWRVAAENSMAGSSLTSRVSAALTDGRHVDALVLLSEMNIREQVPKLGALQRWVRECDAVLTPQTSQEDENRVWQTLDAILRTTHPEFIATCESDNYTFKKGTRLRWYPPFTVQNASTGDANEDTSAVVTDKAALAIKPLQITLGTDRRPPNKYPSIIYSSPVGTFPLLAAPARSKTPVRHDVPGVPGAFIINDVFEPFECESLVSAAEKIGLQPDEPVSGSAVNLASVLAHNLIWLADTNFLDVLFNRVKHLLPQEIRGGAVKGINGRFRLYRYRPGALYRPHIDGAWPASALNSSTDPPSYLYDSDPNLYSRLTFLIYLNDDFDGGCTTFFLPSNRTGILEARPVKPRTGAVCVFPHGSTKGSLLHEGSGVVGDGAKYIIRTEVLYEVDRKERTEIQKE